MLSAIQSASYHSSFYPDKPGDIVLIEDELQDVRRQIRAVYSQFTEMTDLDLDQTTIEETLHAIDQMRIVAADLFSLFEELEEELVEAARHLPDPDQEYDDREAYS